MSIYRHDKKCFKYLQRFIEFKRASKENQIKWKENYVAPENPRYNGTKVIRISLKDMGKYTRYRTFSTFSTSGKIILKMLKHFYRF